MKEMKWGGYLVTICCSELVGLMDMCQGAYLADELTPSRLGIQVETEGCVLFTPVFHCPYCGEKIEVREVRECQN